MSNISDIAHLPETPAPLSPAQTKILKEKLRSLRWRSEAVMRELGMIQKLRTIVSRR